MVAADDVDSLKRFQDQSEPMFMFILNKRVTRVFRGVNNIEFAEVAKEELKYFEMYQKGLNVERVTYEIDEPTLGEKDWLQVRMLEQAEQDAQKVAQRRERQAARKRHRAEMMVPYLRHLNFVLYWPQAKHAHPELYERWDENNIIMVGREEVQLFKETAEDVLYAGDAPLNEASLHALISAPALAICFRLLDLDKDFVTLVRMILYEEIPPKDNSKPIREQKPQKTAFDLYKSYSLPREEIWRQRREERLRKKEEAIYQRERRISELKRLAKQAREGALDARKAEKEQLKLKLLKSGNLEAVEKLKESEDEEVDIEIPEIDEEISEEEDDDEYFPPAGLLIPGFYAPSNDIAKVNGLAILFPKLVLENVTPQEEFLPPHVLVMLHVSKRYKAIKAIAKYKSSIIHMGIFLATTPYDSVHIAHSVKQYDTLEHYINEEDIKLSFMLSMKTDLALLALMDLNPLHVSRDNQWGEEECAAMFPVDYGHEYPELEDFV